jgi:hypothetical protein
MCFSGFPIKTLYAFLFFPILATYPSYLISVLITCIIFKYIYSY